MCLMKPSQNDHAAKERGKNVDANLPTKRCNFFEIKQHSFVQIKQDFTRPEVHAVAGR